MHPFVSRSSHVTSRCVIFFGVAMKQDDVGRTGDHGAHSARPRCRCRLRGGAIVLLMLCVELSLTSFSPATAQSTDCSSDVVSSEQRKSGAITSPSYGTAAGYPSNVVCTFRFYGSDRERVRIVFNDFNLHYPDGDAAFPDKCTNVDVLYVDDDDVATSLSRIGVYCGRRLPPAIMSGPSGRLTVTFVSRSESTTGAGFTAHYSFTTDFGIKSGEQDRNAGCTFTYRSSAGLNGTITSPNFPGLYPRNTRCTYVLLIRPKQRLTITFHHFDMEGIMPECSTATESDYLEVTWLANRPSKRYCSNKDSPPPSPLTATSSDGSQLRLTFQSDGIYDATGFLAHYEFSTFVPSASRPIRVSCRDINFVFTLTLLFEYCANSFYRST